MTKTTLCYIEQNDQYLMLHRVKKEQDENAGKWIGVGGHIEPGESPYDCVMREVFEETGLSLHTCDFRGIVDFYSDIWENERMFLFTSDDFSGEIHECNEGDLKWIPKEEIGGLKLWEGDRIFLDFLKNNLPVFHLDLHYRGDELTKWKLHPRMILASKSPRRIQLLEQIGIYPEVLPGHIKEETDASDPKEIVQDLSRKKAMGVLEELQKRTSSRSECFSRRTFPGTFLIAADTVVAAGENVLGKPGTHREAEEMICLIQGKIHQVFTGVTILELSTEDSECYKVRKQVTFSEQTDVKVAVMSDDEIRQYAMSDEPMDKAGGYGIQGPFAAFIERINGDYNTVVGLPVGRVYRTLRDMSCEIPAGT